ncbi:Transcription elongation factor GreA [Candidatus Hodgkinia cicadicola]|nr:Transcription elongation factor GreA [Candidatus Hodgkinia cicadicola]
MLNPAIAPITAAGYSNLFRQLSWREQHEKPGLKTQLRTTRALGDLSENADHHTAKEDDKRNKNEINEIKTTLITTETMPLKGRGEKTHRVQFNSMVILKEYKTNKHRTYRIIGEREIAKNKNSISIASITAQALVNKKEGHVVVIPRLNSAKAYKIIYIKIW